MNPLNSFPLKIYSIKIPFCWRGAFQSSEDFILVFSTPLVTVFTTHQFTNFTLLITSIYNL